MKTEPFFRKPLPVSAHKYVSWSELLVFLAGRGVQAEHSHAFVTLRVPDQTLTLRPDEWLVIPSRGPLEVHDDASFHLLFERGAQKSQPLTASPAKPLRNKK